MYHGSVLRHGLLNVHYFRFTDIPKRQEIKRVFSDSINKQRQERKRLHINYGRYVSTTIIHLALLCHGCAPESFDRSCCQPMC